MRTCPNVARLLSDRATGGMIATERHRLIPGLQKAEAHLLPLQEFGTGKLNCLARAGDGCVVGLALRLASRRLRIADLPTQERKVMSEQYAALLKTARERLVEDRRAFAKIIAAPFEREKTRDAREKFIDIQAAIEAVDRAIEDEERQVAT